MAQLRGRGRVVCFSTLLAAASLAAQPSITVTQNTTSIGRYDVFELTLTGAGTYANPWEDVAVTAAFTAPSGAVVDAGGFYYDTSTWKVRFAPNQSGSWGWTVTFKTGAGQASASGTFTCTASGNSGFMRVHPANPYRFITEGDGKPFYPVGFDSALPPDGDYRIDDTATGGVDMNQFFDTYAAAGDNIFRLLVAGSNTPLLYQSLNVSGTGKNVYSIANGKSIDAAMAKLRQDRYKVFMTVLGGAPNNGNLSAAGATQSVLSYHKYVIDRYGAYVDVWELMNEQNNVPASYYSTVISFIRGYDPYRHLISTSDPQPALNLDVDITSPHRYYNAYNSSKGSLDPAVGYLADDIAKWKASIPNKPILYGEAGIQSPYNYDPVGYRVWLWTSFFNEAGLIFWNTSYKKTFGTNQYMGAEERAVSKIHSAYIADFDGVARPAEVTLSNPGALRAYALASGRELGVYFLSWDFTSTSSGAAVTVDVPADGMRAEWFDPATGNVIGAMPVSRGSQTLTIPNFTVDIVLRIRGGAPPVSGCADPASIPAGFARPCPVLNVSPSQVSAAGTLTISAASPAGAAANILSTFYINDSGQWLPVTVPGRFGWCTGGCSVTLPAGSLRRLAPGSHAVSSWDWTWNGNCWVGPGGNVCGKGSWRYQEFTVK